MHQQVPPVLLLQYVRLPGLCGRQLWPAPLRSFLEGLGLSALCPHYSFITAGMPLSTGPSERVTRLLETFQ